MRVAEGLSVSQTAGLQHLQEIEDGGGQGILDGEA